jgi:hypothetical protein
MGPEHYPLVPLPSPTEYFPETSCLVFSNTRFSVYLTPGASLGVYLPSAYAEWGALLTRVCLTRYVPLSGFFTLSAVFFSPNLPGFFHPGTLLGFSLQSLPFRKSGSASRRPLPSCHSYLAPSMAGGVVSWPDPSGKETRYVGFRAFFPLGVRSRGSGGLAKTVVGALLGFFLSRVLSLSMT